MKPGSSSVYALGERSGFTLIELLVVIAIIALLAALMVPFTARVAAKRTITRVQMELQRLDAAIESYKATMGFYPPGNSRANLWVDRFQHFSTTLFYELTGCQLVGNVYRDAVGSTVQSGTLEAATGCASILNSPAMGAQPRNFFGSLRSDQHAKLSTSGIREFVMPIEGPEPLYQRDEEGRWVTPWNYDPSSTNRVNGERFDLWIDVIIGKKTNRICNWSPEPLIVYGK